MEENNNERSTKELEIDESQLTKEEINETKKVHAPWGILIFCGVVALAMIVLIIVIVNLK